MHNQPQPGEVIIYHLLPSQRPTDPNKEWHGRVQVVCTPDMVLVELLEPGYEGLQEFVRVSQIVHVNTSK